MGQTEPSLILQTSAVFQLAGRACSWPAGVRLQSQSAANPLRTDQCGVREKGRRGGRSGGGRGGGM